MRIIKNMWLFNNNYRNNGGIDDVRALIGIHML